MREMFGVYKEDEDEDDEEDDEKDNDNEKNDVVVRYASCKLRKNSRGESIISIAI